MTRCETWHRRMLRLLCRFCSHLLVPCAIALVSACGSSTDATTCTPLDSGSQGLAGSITVAPSYPPYPPCGPGCPSTAHSAYTHPVLVRDSRHFVVCQLLPDAEGRFAIQLPPGAYEIDPLPSDEPQFGEGARQATVSRDHVTRADLYFVSGLG